VGNILSINVGEIDFIGRLFRPKIFDIGFPVITFDSTASDGDGIRKNEEDTDTKEDDVQKVETTKNLPQSIDDLLIPATAGDLSSLAENSYYSRKTIPEQTSVSNYIFIPYISGTTLINPDVPKIHKPIEFTTVPYSINYIIDRSGSDYETVAEYGPSEQTYTQIPEPLTYTSELEIFDPRLIAGRELTTYTQSTQVHKIGEMYDIFSFNSSDSLEISVIEPSNYSIQLMDIKSLDIPEIRSSEQTHIQIHEPETYIQSTQIYKTGDASTKPTIPLINTTRAIV